MLQDYSALINSLNEGILLLNDRGHITFVNPAVTSLSGYTAAELTGKPFYILNEHQDDAIRADYELSQAIALGTIVFEGWKQRKDGSRFWSKMSITSMREAGKHTGYACLLCDHTESKDRELKLRMSEERYRLMIEGVKEYSIFLLDASGYVQTWNDGGLHIQGYNAASVIGKHFSMFYTYDDISREKPERELQIARETGKYEDESWRVKKNGSVFWASVVLTALFNDRNELIGYSKVTRDLTDRLKDEESLRQSEETHRLLVEQVADYGIFMLDEKGRIISWNEGARKIKGYSSEEILGKYFSIFYTEDDILNGKPAYELKVARAEGKYEEEGWRLRKDGSHFWANVVITAIYNPDRTLVGFAKVTRDLTERKKSEQALRESSEGYRQLAEDLKDTNSQLTYVNQELEQFTSIVSHDLKEPVRTVKSFLYLMEKKVEQTGYEDLKTYIGKSMSATNRMTDLIENLLQYSQISKGDIMVEVISVDQLFQQVSQNIRQMTEASGAQISLTSDVDRITADSIQLGQLIQNLLINAIKFRGSRKPEIQVNCQQKTGYTHFSVADNGIGIEAENLDKIFDVFRRLHSEKEYPGTGMGLAICKKVVERHHGRIWAESRPGEGTTFHFTVMDQLNQVKNPSYETN